MARTTHVAKAQQRYETVPVIDPETGEPKRTPVMKTVRIHSDATTSPEVRRVQKTTKRGKPVFMTVTVQDKSKPLPPYKCDAPGCPHPDRVIEIGTPYKHITPKSGPYGGRKRTRHESCPSWQVWEYSNSLSAQLAQISHDFGTAVDSAESADDIQSALDDASSSVTEIAEEKQEGADNIESGFGHETSASEELRSIAEQLTEWAGEITGAEIPELAACEDCTDGQVDCEDCEGSGYNKDDDGEDTADACDNCSGNGQVDCETCDGTGEDIDAWRDAVRDEVTIVDESPV